MLQSFSGATVKRVVDRSRSCVPEHAHDWPVLSVFVIGSFLNETEIGPRLIGAPSAIFYRAGAAHRNTVGPEGFEQIEIEFDPAWLGEASLPGTCISIALESGFCDQSHMNRTFRRVLGRSPLEVREDRHAFRQITANAKFAQ